MKIRPLSITIIAWFLVISGGIGVISAIVMRKNPMVQEVMQKTPVPIPIQYLLMYVGMVIMLVCAVGMLKGFNWARFLYVIWSGLSFVYGFATSPMKATLIPGLLFFGIVVFFLFRPKAKEYFCPTPVPPPIDERL